MNFHRAIPDCRDGLKPVQRYLLFAMHKMGLTGAGPKTMTKVQAVASEVSGKYHPHGDAAAAAALYKLGQDWIMRYPLAVAEGKLSVDDEVLKFFPDDAPADPSANLKAMRVSAESGSP